MRILALETTERVGSVALLTDETLEAEVTLRADQRSSQSLIPSAKSLLEQTGWKVSELDLIAVSVGPGSFTGLRVGVTAAKTLAYAIGSEALGVSTMEVIALQAPGSPGRLSVVMDAQRRQLFVAIFEADSDGSWQLTEPTRIVDIQPWLDGLSKNDIVTGPGLRKLLDEVPQGVTVVDVSCWAPTAAAVGLLALEQHQAGRRDDIWNLLPDYCRQSAAEEKWEARQRDVRGDT